MLIGLFVPVESEATTRASVSPQLPVSPTWKVMSMMHFCVVFLSTVGVPLRLMGAGLVGGDGTSAVGRLAGGLGGGIGAPPIPTQ